MKITNHARARCQQRGIPMILIGLLEQFGASEPAGDGASKFYFDKTSRRRVKAYAGPISAYLEQHLDVYAVIGPDGQVITIAHRIERIRRH